MLRTLSANYAQTEISIFKNGKICSVRFHPGKEADIVFQNGKVVKAGCINCIDPQCVYLRDIDIECAEFPDIVHDMSKYVCPVGAIKSGESHILIDDKKCLGCGLCAASCPVGAIYLKEGKAHISRAEKKDLEVFSTDPVCILKQNKFLTENDNADRTGIIQKESEPIISEICEAIKRLPQEEQNILARNLMIKLGNKATLARQGNVYMRMDGFYSNKKQFGVIEIDLGADMLDVSRAILDDVAVINVRYGIEKNKNHPLAIVLSLPNKRTDYWQVIKDIRDIIKIPISTITFGALLILLWNHKEVYDFDKFYIDVDNSSIRSEITSLIARPIDIEDGFYGVLENGK
jgi:Fe-S-cluster-containing hydrogenase component 2